MTSTHAVSLSPVAFRLAAALERYQAEFDQLLESWFDWNRCRMVMREIDDIDKLRGALPQLAADLTDVVMRHVEVLRSLFRGSVCAEPGAASDIPALIGRHRAAIESLRSKCLRLITRER